MLTPARRIHVIDSHTEGEPTRVVVAGGPPLGNSSLSERRALFRSDYDHFRAAVINEPRGSDVLVGALLCEPSDSSCTAGVIFFNNVGYLGMCGHGTIGVITTLAHLGRLQPGIHRLETPVGIVTAELHDTGEVSFQNVPAYRCRQNVAIAVENFGLVTGDVAWGGNWFFLTRDAPCPIEFSNVGCLTDYSWDIRRELTRQAIGGDDGGEIDHIEIFGEPGDLAADSRNFVLCPGKSYDRSPCGTGTSAKLACLYGDGKLRADEIYRQAGILGTVFEGWVTLQGNCIHPHIKGRAFITSEADLILDERDPFQWGIRY